MAADLRVTSQSSVPVINIGSTLSFTLTVTNDGPDPATGVTAADLLPAGFTFVSATAEPGMSYDETSFGLWTIGNLAAGQTATLVIQAKATSAGSFNNTISITHSDVADGNSGNDSAQAPVVVNDVPDLRGLDSSFTTNETKAHTPAVIDVAVSFTDSDFAGTASPSGSLSTIRVSGLLPEDRVWIKEDNLVQFLDATRIAVLGSEAATVTGGNGTDLVVQFYESFSDEDYVRTVIQHLTYQNLSDAPTQTRTLSITVTDQYGATSEALHPFFKVRAEAPNPFAGVSIDIGRTLSFADLNGDGPTDIVTGSLDGTLHVFYLNANGSYTDQTGGSPFGLVDVGTNSAPRFGDVDGDHAVDLVVGAEDGTLHFYRNIAGVFVEQLGPANPFDGIDVNTRSVPALGDINHDGRLDLVVGNGGGTLRMWLQNPDGTFTEQTSGANPLSGVDVGTNSSPVFADLNGDGHLYLIVGGANDQVLRSFVQNAAGGFIALTGAANPLPGGVGTQSAPAFTDLNGDGDLDLAIGAGGLLFALSNDPRLPQVVVTVFAQNDLPKLSGLVTSLAVAENGAATLIDSSVTFADNDFHGGSIAVSGLLAEDRVALLTDATVTLAGTTVSVGGTAVGTVAGGTGTNFTITLTSAASAATVETLLEHLTYRDVSDTPTNHIISIRVTDDAGAATDAFAIPTLPDSSNRFPGISTGSGLPVTFGDLNGDGRLDLVTGTDAGPLRTYFQNPDGTWTEVTGASNPFNGIAAAVVGTLTAPALGDLDGDGDLDLIVGNFQGHFHTYIQSGGVFTLTNIGMDAFSTFETSTPVIFDFNGDGLGDVVSGDRSGQLFAYRNNGDGTFTRLTGSDNPFGAVDIVSGYSAPTFGDLNGDGRADLVVGAADGTVATFYQNADGSFSAPASNPLAGIAFAGGFAAPALADFNGDGNLDLAVSETGGTLNSFTNNKQVHDVAITVTAANDAPVNTMPAGPINAPSATAIAGLAIADLDAGSGIVTTTLSVLHGTLTIGSAGGAAVSGSGSATATLTGTVAQINTTLSAASNVVYTGSPDYFGADTLTMLTSDNGNTGGAALSDSDQVTITVNTTITGTPGPDSYTVTPGAVRIDAGLGLDTMNFDFRLVDATVKYVGNTVVIDGPSGSHTVLTGFEVFNFTDGTVHNDDGNPPVDDLFYYSRYHDVWNAHLDADADYNATGWHLGRDPSFFFSTSTYLSANPDVKAAGVNPLTHFDTIGWKEGRVPSIHFDPAQYLAANHDVAAAHVDPLGHYMALGYQEGRLPFAASELVTANGFDYVYYLNHNPDVAAAGVDPFQHFETVGWKEGRNPNALFDTNGYLANYADVAAAHVNPLDHYNVFGWKEGRDPSIGFDTVSYLGANPDVAAAHINPLTHFLYFGQDEGRLPLGDGVFR